MTWFKIDDTLAFHPKVVAAGLAAMGLWVRAGSWSAQQLTDGRIPAHMVPALSDGQPDLADRLVDAGLWERDGDGYRFHDWADRNPTRRQVEAERKARQAAGRAGGKRSGETRRSRTEAPARSKPEATASPIVEPPSRPVPSRPDQGRLAASLAREPRAAAPAAAVEAWIGACDVKPDRRERVEAQRVAAELIAAGNPADAVIEAARRTGAEGYGPRGFPHALRRLAATGRPSMTKVEERIARTQAMKRGQVLDGDVVELRPVGGDPC